MLDAPLNFQVINDSHDLTNLLVSSPSYSAPDFADALRILESLKAAPGCNQAALRKLIHSCKDASLKERQIVPETLEQAKTSYAINAALCETAEGGGEIPEQCRAVSARLYQHDHGNLARRVHDPQDNQNCLATFQENHVYWVSYSNNRQQASVICQAARHGIDRDEALEVFAATVDVSRELNELQQELSHRLREAIEDLLAGELKAENLQQANLALSKEIHEQSLRQTQEILDRIQLSAQNGVKDFEQGMDGVMKQVDSVHMVGFCPLAVNGH